jgi:hypothetical protein
MSVINFLAARISIKRVRSVFPALPLLYFMVRAYFISAETNAIYMDKDSTQEKAFSMAGLNENNSYADYMKITFHESVGVYKLLKSQPGYVTYSGFREEENRRKLFVHVTPVLDYSDKIMNIP